MLPSAFELFEQAQKRAIQLEHIAEAERKAAEAERKKARKLAGKLRSMAIDPDEV